MEELSVTRVPVTGTWLRHVPAGSDPLYRPPTPADGRWQRGTNVEGIYLAAGEATVARSPRTRLSVSAFSHGGGGA